MGRTASGAAETEVVVAVGRRGRRGRPAGGRRLGLRRRASAAASAVVGTARGMVDAPFSAVFVVGGALRRASSWDIVVDEHAIEGVFPPPGR